VRVVSFRSGLPSTLSTFDASTRREWRFVFWGLPVDCRYVVSYDCRTRSSIFRRAPFASIIASACRFVELLPYYPPTDWQPYLFMLFSFPFGLVGTAPSNCFFCYGVWFSNPYSQNHSIPIMKVCLCWGVPFSLLPLASLLPSPFFLELCKLFTLAILEGMDCKSPIPTSFTWTPIQEYLWS